MSEYTEGSGSYHFPEDLLKDILKFLRAKGVDTSMGYGVRPSRKRHFLSIVSGLLDLPSLQYHGIPRALYVIPNVSNLKATLAEAEPPAWHD